MHHAIADGIAGVATLGTFLDATSCAPAGAARPWTPAPSPPARALVADNLRQRAAGVGGAFSALARPVPTARKVHDVLSATRGLFSAQPTPRTSLDQVVVSDRRVAIIRGNLDLVKRVAHLHGAKVNDVLLAVTGAGVRGFSPAAANRSRTSPCRSTCPSRYGRPSAASRPAGT